MKQWFRGRFDGHYVGRPFAHPRSAVDGTRHFRMHVYRGIVSELQTLDADSPLLHQRLADGSLGEAPAGTLRASNAEDRGTPSPHFTQSRIAEVTVLGLRGAASRYEGPIHDVSLQSIRISDPVSHHGRSYGRIEGEAIAYCELPEPKPRASDPALTGRLVLPEEEAARVEPARLVVAGALSDDPNSDGVGRSAPEGRKGSSLGADDPEVDEASNELAARPAKLQPPAPPTSGTTLYVLATAAALGLGLACGVEAALLWVAFVLPTLLARSLFGGVLRDSVGVRAFGLSLMCVSIGAVSSLVSSWWWSSCRELSVVPLLVIVAVLFPSGLLPSVAPLTVNAAGLGLVLGLWASAPASACGTKERPASAAPSVQDPGVPRTNADGSWPKRPPGQGLDPRSAANRPR